MSEFELFWDMCGWLADGSLYCGAVLIWHAAEGNEWLWLI